MLQPLLLLNQYVVGNVEIYPYQIKLMEYYWNPNDPASKITDWFQMTLYTRLLERPGRPLPRVWPRGQCRQVTHDDVPTQRTMVKDA